MVQGMFFFGILSYSLLCGFLSLLKKIRFKNSVDRKIYTGATSGFYMYCSGICPEHAVLHRVIIVGGLFVRASDLTWPSFRYIALLIIAARGVGSLRSVN